MTDLITGLGKEHQEFLRDESRSLGWANSISFPGTQDELREIVSLAARHQLPLTIQGARTGLTGGAVPYGGHILNLGKMNRITGLRHDPKLDCFLLRVQSGVLLSQVRRALDSMQFETTGWSQESVEALALLRQRGLHFFSPDPTESSASIGGMVNCNASGARSFYYGPTRGYVQSLQVVLTDGTCLSLRRGVDRVKNGQFRVISESGKVVEGTLPSYSMPDVKNASGYYLKPDMDLVDVFIGSEGTLGIISEVELRLLPKPRAIWGISAFFPSEQSALLFVRAVRGEAIPVQNQPSVQRPVAIEYFDYRALDLLRKQKEHNAGFGQIQDIKPAYHTAVYVEFHGDSDELVAEWVMQLGTLIVACGGDEADTWVASSPRDLEKLQLFRHAVPESVNMLIDQRRKLEPALTKLGTDMAVSDCHLASMLELYNRRLSEAGLEAAVFGHIGNNHVHVNILPRNLDEYQSGKELYLEWAREAVAAGGTVSAEHGIGKLKTAFLTVMYGETGLLKMRAVKRLFDPQSLLSPGNMFAPEHLEGR